MLIVNGCINKVEFRWVLSLLEGTTSNQRILSGLCVDYQNTLSPEAKIAQFRYRSYFGCNSSLVSASTRYKERVPS